MNNLYVIILFTWSVIICTGNSAPTTPPAADYHNVVQITDQPIEAYKHVRKPQTAESSLGNSDDGIENAQFVIAVIEMKPIEENAKARIGSDSGKGTEHKGDGIVSERSKRDIDYYDNDDDDFQTADTRVFMPYVRYRTISGQRFYINRRYDRPHYPAMVGYADNTDRFPTVA